MKSAFIILGIIFMILITSCSGDKSINTIPEKGKSDNGQTDNGTVRIGTQIWMTKNLDVDHYLNGDPIPQVTDPDEWANLTTGAWCYYKNDPAYGAIYGKIYNWYAINDPRGLAPSGYRIPTIEDWDLLINHLSGDKLAGGKLKETGTVHWEIPNLNASNSSGFTALPGGYRSFFGSFGGLGTTCDIWAYDNQGTAKIWDIYVHNDKSYIVRDSVSKNDGLAVRCISILPAH